MARFVTAVKKHIYKFDGTYYNVKPVVLNRLWIKVANDIGNVATPKECKARWQAMRCCYTDFIRNGTRMKPAEIEPHLDFLIPDVKLDPSVEETTASGTLADSLEFYARLAGIVRQHPVLYDGAYSNSKLDPIWQQVAEAMGGTATWAELKVQWRNLRHRYTMFLKHGAKIKPYGIESYLEFLEPYLKFWRETPENSLEYNVRLVGVIREHGCLYNGQRDGSMPAAWEDVANRMGTNIEWCQTRWTRFRERYSRFLLDGTRMKPVGIEAHLAFLNSYLRAKRVGPPRKKFCQGEDHGLNAPAAIVERFRYLMYDETDEDVLFLLRFVQDMARMDEKEKSAFKVGAKKAVQSCLRK
ncbi:hypothetical protein pipiens_018292 [Culex pipiens pipiens]|uniref:MADF domain-containing protein n=1 Tax=Culex pipiens pipiens TaxID=38569 RepID=A0ABD1CCH0_CULPP